MGVNSTLTAVFNARDNISNRLSAMANSGQSASRSFFNFKTVAIASFAAVTAAAGVLAKEGIEEFAKFEKGMNEVFSILPDMSAKAMDGMEEQVLDLSKKMGVLPEKLVPALYESISSGIPQENVFTFLEVAQKSAIAGVADVQVAVDGLTTVINTYGAANIDAAKSSDIIFQTVKLGKTTFDEMSSSLSNVLPSAKAAGVNFEQVGAMMATVTSQGVRTAEATTKLRSMMDELQKPSTKISGLFKQLAKKDFRKFIAEGGNVQQALQLIEKHAQKTGKNIGDLFSSVEAAGAAQMLTGQGTEMFTNSLDAMANSAGSTEKAYSKMDRGLARTMERLKANWSVALIKIGDALAPSLEKVGNALLLMMDPLQDGLENGLNTISNWASKVPRILAKVGDAFHVTSWVSNFEQSQRELTDKFNEMTHGFSATPLFALVARFQEAGQGFANAMAPYLPVVTDIVNQIINVFTAIGTTALDMFQGGVIPALFTLVGVFNDTILPAITTFVEYVTTTVWPWLDQAIQFFTSTTLPILRDAFNTIFPALAVIVGDAFELIAMIWNNVLFPVIQNVVSRMMFMWTMITNIVSQNRGTIQTLVTAICNIFTGLANFITGVFTGNWRKAWEGVKQVFAGIFGGIKGIFQGVINIITGGINGLIDKVNSVAKIKIPSWVPGVGGKTIAPKIPKIPALADGATNWPGGHAWVGETGEPEIVTGPTLANLPKGSNVLGVDETRKILSGVGGSSNGPSTQDNRVFHITLPNAQTIRAEGQEQFISRVRDAVLTILERDMFEGGNEAYEF